MFFFYGLLLEYVVFLFYIQIIYSLNMEHVMRFLYVTLARWCYKPNKLPMKERPNAFGTAAFISQRELERQRVRESEMKLSYMCVLHKCVWYHLVVGERKKTNNQNKRAQNYPFCYKASTLSLIQYSGMTVINYHMNSWWTDKRAMQCSYGVAIKGKKLVFKGKSSKSKGNSCK